jgi:hypothetical protein
MITPMMTKNLKTIPNCPKRSNTLLVHGAWGKLYSYMGRDEANILEEILG